MRSAALPVHRHALPQLVVDGVLVALAYFLAFWLRFAGHPWGTQIRYHDAGTVVKIGYDHRYRLLFTHTAWWVVILVLAALMVFGQYERLWRFVGQRDYEAVLKGVVLATLVAVTLIALIHPVTVAAGLQRSEGTWIALGTTNPYLPASVIALFLLLSMALLIGARFAVQLVTDGRVRVFGADAGAREVLIVGGGEGGRLVVRELLRNKSLGLRPGRLPRRRPGQAEDQGRARPAGARHHAGGRSRPGAGRDRARRGRDRDPVRARRAARPGRDRVPCARDPGAHDPDRVRAAA